MQSDGAASPLGLQLSPDDPGVAQRGPDPVRFTVGSESEALEEGAGGVRFNSNSLSVTVDPRLLPKRGGRGGRRRGRGRGEESGRGRGASPQDLPRERDARLRRNPKPRQIFDA